jgi:hypothetical protein
MTDDPTAFEELAAQTEPTRFVLYGWRLEDGELGAPWHKVARSLSEVLDDLEGFEGRFDEGGYIIRDAFLEMDDGSPVIHVELVSSRELRERLDETE